MATAPALALSFWRLAYATALLAPLTVPAMRRELPALDRRGRMELIAAGVFLALHFALWIGSLAPSSPYATSVAASAALVALHPVLVALAAPWLTGKPVPKGARAGIAVALAGAVVIALGDSSRGAHRVTGDLLAFGGAVMGAGYFLLGSRLRARLSVFAYVGPVYLTAAVVLAAMAWATCTPLGAGAREHGLFFAMALGPMVLGHGLLNWALGYLPAWAVSAVILAEPIASAVLVFAVLGETPPWTAGVGAVAVLAGLGLITAKGGG